MQDIEEFERSVRSFRTEPNTDIIIIGSNARMLSNELSTLIGGRYKEIYIQSLGYNEFLEFHNLSDNDEPLCRLVSTKPEGQRIYVQASFIIAEQATREREFGILRSIKDNYPKCVISMMPLLTKNDDDGIPHIHLRKFLREGL